MGLGIPSQLVLRIRELREALGLTQAESVMEPTVMCYGDRNAGVRNPAGNTWWIATRFRDVSPAELEKLARDR